MKTNFRQGHILFSIFFSFALSCAYFNTLYNAQQYFNEAEKIRLAKEGKAILMISSELPEIIGMSDRVLVMREGKISADLSRENLSQETILRHAMVGTET